MPSAFGSLDWEKALVPSANEEMAIADMAMNLVALFISILLWQGFISVVIGGIARNSFRSELFVKESLVVAVLLIEAHPAASLEALLFVKCLDGLASVDVHAQEFRA